MKLSRPATLAIVSALALLQLLLSGAISACARPVAGAAVAAGHGDPADHGRHHGRPAEDGIPATAAEDCPLMLGCATAATVPPPPIVAVAEAPHLSPPTRIGQAPAGPDLDPDTPPPRG